MGQKSASIELVGKLPGLSGDTVGSVEVEGGRAYLASAQSGLRIVDISEPSRPTILNQQLQGRGVRTAVVSGQRVLVATHDGSVLLLDVEDARKPRELAVYRSANPIFGMALQGDRALLVDRERLIVLRLSAGGVEELAQYELHLGVAVTLRPQRAYVLAEFHGLRILDLSQPASPREIGFFEGPANAIKVALAGERAFVADYEGGVWALDLGNEAKPKALGQFAEASMIGDIALTERGQLCVAGGGLELFDVMTPRPRLVASHQPADGGTIWRVAALGDFVYTVGDDARFYIFRPRPPAP